MDQEDREQFKTLHATSATLPVRAISPSPRDRALCSLPVATERARLLLGSYRRGDAADPETYVGAVVLVLSEYLEQVVLRVTDPRGGLPGTSQYLPTVPEVRAACEAEMKPIYEAGRLQRLRETNAKLLGAPKALDKTDLERRREFIAGWRRDVMERLGGSDPVKDARKMPEGSPERAALVAKLRADLDGKIAEWAASDAARAEAAAPRKETGFD